MKKRILIAIHYLEIGGAESALIGLLSNLDYSRLDVDLFLYDHRGEMMQYIQKEVNVLPSINEYSMLERPISELILKGFYRLAFARLKAKLRHKREKHSFGKGSDSSIFYYVAEATLKCLPDINPSVCYDAAISFLTPHQYVRNKVNATKYLAWIHTDYSKVFVNADLEMPVWDSYDRIVSISDGVTNAFLQVFPTLQDKIIEIPNVLPKSLIFKKSNDFVPKEMDFDGIKILSIGRFCEAKNYDNVPKIARLLVDKGLRFRWYIIGYGDRSEIERAIIDSNVSEYVIILGKRDNPYPYIKACDIYAQPSRYEGRSVTVEEAKLLCRPILLTNYFTAKYQIEDGKTGIITETDNQSIADGLYRLASDESLRHKLCDNLSHCVNDDDKIIDKLYQLIES